VNKYSLRDFLFPFPSPLTEAEIEREKSITAAETQDSAARVSKLSDTPESVLTGSLAACTKLQDDEENRKQGIETRLTTILGLSSIAGTIVFGGILAQAVGTIRPESNLLRLVMAIGAVYLSLQICSAILAAVHGLMTRGYQTQLTNSAIPAADETQPAYIRRQINECVARVQNHRARNNSKATQLIAAHQAMKQFVFGLILLAVVGGIAALFAKKPADVFVQTLKNNHELSETLRGAQGMKGDVGPQGPKGDVGPQGPTSQRCKVRTKQPSPKLPKGKGCPP
jgi:hypothetical protein